MTAISRSNCRHCGAEYVDGESTCWQCGKPLVDTPAPEPAPAAPEAQPAVPAHRRIGRQPRPEPPPPPTADDLIHFEEAAMAAKTAQRKRTAVTLAGEVVEIDEPDETTRPLAEDPDKTQAMAAEIAGTKIAGAPPEELMYLQFCKNCGYQNVEGAKECAKCRLPLEVVKAGSLPELEPVPRQWGFDVLGAVWIVLGLAAVWCGWFLIKVDATRAHKEWSDYLWTGVIVLAPGVLIFMRAALCKILFYVMTLGSALVWAAIFIVWITGHLFVATYNAQIGFMWLGAFSALSAVSWALVRLNDAFDWSP